MTDFGAFLLTSGIVLAALFIGTGIEAGLKAIGDALRNQNWSVNLPPIVVKREDER